MKKIVISIGDPNGVGPEIILKFHKKYPKIKMVVFGDKTTLDFWSKFYEIKYSFDCGLDLSGKAIWILNRKLKDSSL